MNSCKAEENSAPLPPSSNTGATTPFPPLTVSPDWFSLTFPPDFKLASLEEQMGRQYPNTTPQPLGFGGKGYSRSIKYGSAKVYYQGADNMGVHLELTGDAIRSCRDYRDLLGFAYEAGATCSRFDIACDDQGQRVLDIDQMTAAADNCAQLGAFRRYRPIKESTSNGRLLAHGVNFGSRQSEVYCRVYDKRLERIAHKVDLATLPAYHVRLEFELKNKTATAAFRSYLESGFINLAGLLGGFCSKYLSFREVNPADSHRYRWAVSGWWSSFLETLPRVQTVIDRAISTIHKKAKWFQVSVAHTFAILLKSPLYGSDWLQGHVASAVRRLTEEDLNLANDVPF